MSLQLCYLQCTSPSCAGSTLHEIFLGICAMKMTSQTSWGFPYNPGFIFPASHSGFTGTLCRNSQPATHIAWIRMLSETSKEKQPHNLLSLAPFMHPKSVYMDDTTHFFSWLRVEPESLGPRCNNFSMLQRVKTCLCNC